MTTFEERAARNEALFRGVNEEIVELAERLHDSAEPIGLMCECDDVGCTEHIFLKREEYERARADGRRFVLAVGHENPEIEIVIERHDGYLIVEKTGRAGAIAARTDPR